MSKGVQTIIYPVKDIDKAKAFYRNVLGMEPETDQPSYVGFRIGIQEIGLDPNGHRQGMTGPMGYFHVDDINKRLQILMESGATVQQGVKDVGGGKLTAWVKDADGNTIGLIQES